MKEKRYYFNGNLNVNQVVSLDGDEFHHMSNVMRVRVGDKICLINGDGNFYLSSIKSLNKKNAEIFVEEKISSESEPNINLTLFQALAKGDKLSLITQKATELGISKICFFESKFSDIKSNTHKADRLDTIAISATKQCGRATIPEIVSTLTIKSITKQISEYDAFYVAYENEDGHTLVDAIENLDKKAQNIAFMVGAEGGFSEDEINLLKSSGANIVSLGSRILRTETAAIAMTAIIMGILDNKR